MRLRISATVTWWVNRVIFVSVAALAFLLPWLMDLYIAARPLDSDAQKAIFLAYYACTPVVLFALWNIEWLVRRILAGDVFIPNNVRRISRLRWCCLHMSLGGFCNHVLLLPDPPLVPVFPEALAFWLRLCIAVARRHRVIIHNILPCNIFRGRFLHILRILLFRGVCHRRQKKRLGGEFSFNGGRLFIILQKAVGSVRHII